MIKIYFSKVSNSLPFLLGLTTGLLFFTLQINGIRFEYFPGDCGDGHFNLYLLEHTYRFFTGKIHGFWNAPFMYPEPNIIAYSDIV